MKNNILNYYIKSKKFLFPLFLDLASVIMVFWVIIPQISSISDQQKQISDQRAEVEELKASLSTLVSQPDQTLDDNFSIALKALPVEKDVSTIFSALSSAASSSDTVLGDFSLNVGGVFGRAAKLAEGAVNVPFILVTADAKGSSTRELLEILDKLSESVPLSEAKRFSVLDNSASFDVNFFYQPIDVTKVAGTFKVKPTSQNDLNMIQEMRDWIK